MNRLAMIGTTAFFLLSSGLAFAAPSLQGSTGLINTQTADVLRGGQFSVGLDHVREGTTENIVFGVGAQTEVGVNLIRHRGESQQMLLNAKLALVPEQILIPGLSVGVEDALNRSQRTEYVAISKTFPWGIRLHVGGGNGRYHGAFGGVEKSLNPLVTMIAEYDGSTVNYGTRLTLLPGLKLEGGLRSHHAYYGLNFTM